MKEERAKLDKIKEKAEDCEAEPVATPGAIQPHGVLLVLDPYLKIMQVSENAPQVVGSKVEDLLDQPLSTLLGEKQAQSIRSKVEAETERSVDPYLRTLPHSELTIEVNGREKDFDGIIHRNEQDMLLLELEPRDLFDGYAVEDPYQLTKSAILKMQQAANSPTLYNIIVDEFAALTNFDRVMVYQFDEEYHGDVIAEYLRKGSFDTSYLGLHFPNSDIPRNARELYKKNWLRIIPDREYDPVEIRSSASWQRNEPLDLSQSVLRSVSHYHVEYLQVMNVEATMSVSIFEGDRLWGLIACHCKSVRYIPYSIRMACEFIGQSLSLILTQRQSRKLDLKINDLEHVFRRMAAVVAGKASLTEAIKRQEPDLLRLMQAQGFAMLDHQEIFIGVTPGRRQMYDLRRWLDNQFDQNKDKDVYYTNQLAKEYEPAQEYQERCSGLLALRMEHPTEGYLIWFREEEEATVNWGGKPEKEVVEDERGIRFSPRKSFEIWQQNRRGHSRHWDLTSLRIARQFRTRLYEVQSIIFRNFETEKILLEQRVQERTEQLEKSNNLLIESIDNKEVLQKRLTDNLTTLKAANEALERFAYVTSHDLREPLRVVSNFSQILEKKNMHQLDEKGQQYLKFIQEGTRRMQKLIDDLLKYSRVQRDNQSERKISTENALNEAMQSLQVELEASQGKVERLGSLPPVWGERSLIIQVFQNLVGNALKYRHPDRNPEINIWATEENEHYYRFFIRDNGIGISPEHYETIFQIFQRLHTVEEYEGTGIGLSICEKIVEKFGGEIGVSSQLGKGSTFYLTLPKAEENAGR